MSPNLPLSVAHDAGKPYTRCLTYQFTVSVGYNVLLIYECLQCLSDFSFPFLATPAVVVRGAVAQHTHSHPPSKKNHASRSRQKRDDRGVEVVMYLLLYVDEAS